MPPGRVHPAAELPPVHQRLHPGWPVQRHQRPHRHRAQRCGERGLTTGRRLPWARSAFAVPPSKMC